MPVLEVQNLRMYYDTSEGPVKAVDGISMEVEKGEVLGIVGESGCGKSSLALTLLKLLPYNAKILEGEINVEGTPIVSMSDSDVRRRIRWTKIAMIPQGSMNSLNPVFKVGDQISEAMTIHQSVTKGEAAERTVALLKLVGIDPARAGHYPHEFSGGMKQRAMIAMSLVMNPRVLIADEPTTALDVMVQAGIIRLLLRLKTEMEMALILISHDLALVAQMSDKVAIMYAGKFVEYGESAEVYKKPLHPYTIGLLGAFADIRKPREKLVSIPGAPPNLVNPPPGCRFAPRCPYAKQICEESDPVLEVASPGHLVACHFWKTIREKRKAGA